MPLKIALIEGNLWHSLLRHPMAQRPQPSEKAILEGSRTEGNRPPGYRVVSPRAKVTSWLADTVKR
jgi:hypothetical protein